MNTQQDDILMMQTIERYLDGTMLPDEKAYFEQLRKNTPEIDQMVVEHSMFLHEMDEYVVQRNFRNTLNNVHSKLVAEGAINEGGLLPAQGKVVRLYNKYKKDLLMAACVGGAIVLSIGSVLLYFSPSSKSNQIEQLSKDIANIKYNQAVQSTMIKQVKSKLPVDYTPVNGGTGFLVDGKGYLVTNAHVLRNSNAVIVSNPNGNEFRAEIVHIDAVNDIALLKIIDDDFKPLKSLPYSINKSGAKLGEEIFTLGYPKNDITYTQGYLSSKTGFNGDTVTYQIQISSNPGNSGGPVLNKNGEVIGILSTRQTQADGVTFAIKSRNIYNLVDDLKKEDSSLQKIKMPSISSISGKDRSSQVEKIEDCVFAIKTYKSRQ